MDDIKESIACLFIDIKEKIEDYYIFNEKKGFKECFLKTIYKLCGRYIKANMLSYNHIALEFNKVYFFKNLLKNIIFFEKYYYLIGDSILDVGCGAAPASIAIASLVKSKNGKDISISLIDRSKKQLSIAEDIAQIMSIKIKSCTEAFFDMKIKKYTELVVFSYFFCEQKKDFLKKLFDNREKFTGGFVIIDYDVNIMKVEKYFRDNGDNKIKYVFINYSVPKILSGVIYDKEVKVYGCIYRL